MATASSALAQSLVRHKEDEILQAVALLLSARPELRISLARVTQEEPGGRCIGEITAFYPQKKYGFIRCDEVSAQYGVDTFLSSLEIGPFGVGSIVSFSVSLNKEGKPQARLLEDATAGGAAAGGGGAAALHELMPPPPVEQFSLPGGAGGGWQPPSPEPGPPGELPPPKRPRWTDAIGAAPPRPPPQAPLVVGLAPPAHDGVLQEMRYTGTISAFYPAKRYGFIESEEVTQQFGMDAFLSDKEVGPFSVGSFVSFSIAQNKKGCPQARDLRPASTPAEASALLLDSWCRGESENQPSPPPPTSLLHPSGGTGAPVGKGSGSKGASPRVLKVSDDRYVGEIKAFYPDRKFGFITCGELKDQFGVDTFLSDKEIGSFTNGDVVSFTVGLNGQGRPQAHDLEAAARPDPAPM